MCRFICVTFDVCPYGIDVWLWLTHLLRLCITFLLSTHADTIGKRVSALHAQTSSRVLFFVNVKAVLNTIMVGVGWKLPGAFKETKKAGAKPGAGAVAEAAGGAVSPPCVRLLSDPADAEPGALCSEGSIALDMPGLNSRDLSPVMLPRIQAVRGAGRSEAVAEGQEGAPDAVEVPLDGGGSMGELWVHEAAGGSSFESHMSPVHQRMVRVRRSQARFASLCAEQSMCAAILHISDRVESKHDVREHDVREHDVREQVAGECRRSWPARRLCRISTGRRFCWSRSRRGRSAPTPHTRHHTAPWDHHAPHRPGKTQIEAIAA